jgi:hypothetical protein
MESNRGNNGHGDGFRQELLTSEHIPYQLILMNAVEDVRRGISSHNDGGLGALLSLYSVLPVKIRSQLNGLDEEILKYLKLRITIQRVSHREKRYIRGGYKLDEPEGGVLGSARYVPDGTGRTTWVTVANMKVNKDYQTTREHQRDFAYNTLIRIIDILENEGILWKSRLEMIGGED